jgi:hypothetical protein
MDPHNHEWSHHLVQNWTDLTHGIGAMLEKRRFFRQMMRILAMLTGLGACSIAVGAIGFHWTERLDWLDSFYWATMIITGCGLPTLPTQDAAKVWGIFYAFYGEAYFAGVFVALLTPVAHSLIRRYVRIAQKARTSPASQPLPPNPPQ